jgi:hypothetical protein
VRAPILVVFQIRAGKRFPPPALWPGRALRPLPLTAGLLGLPSPETFGHGGLNFGGCAVVISHDRWFLDRIATHILAFEGDSKTVWCEGNYQTYEAQRKQRLGQEADQPHRIRYKKLHQ